MFHILLAIFIRWITSDFFPSAIKADLHRMKIMYFFTKAVTGIIKKSSNHAF